MPRNRFIDRCLLRCLLLNCLLLLLVLSGMSCAGPGNRTDQPVGMLAADLGAGPYKKTVAVLPGISPTAVAGRQPVGSYLQKLIEAIREEGPELILVTPEAEELSAAGGADIAALLGLSRSQGYQALLVASQSEVSIVSEKSGILWFRKSRDYARYSIVVDLYDPYTGTKLLSRVLERQTGISAQEAESLKAAGTQSVPPVDEDLEDITEELGEEVVDLLENLPWQAAVAAVEQSRALLPAGRREGLKIGDRLAVYKTARVIAGMAGEKFAMPSEKAGEVRILEVKERSAEAAVEGRGLVQAGDIITPMP